MSRWALILLFTYLTLGMSRMGAGKATRVAVIVTTLVIGFVMARSGSKA